MLFLFVNIEDYFIAEWESHMYFHSLNFPLEKSKSIRKRYDDLLVSVMEQRENLLARRRAFDNALEAFSLKLVKLEDAVGEGIDQLQTVQEKVKTVEVRKLQEIVRGQGDRLH